MNIKTCRLAIIIVFINLFSSSGFAADRLSVFVSILPQKYFLQQIGGDRVDVRVMVQPGASPATYEPKPGQMAALTKTRVYFAIGVPFENTWLKKFAAANPEMKVIHTDRGIEKISMAAHAHNDHAGEIGQRGLDPHIWLSPPLVKIQAQTILNALQEIDPPHRTDYATNFNQFVSDINDLDAELQATFAGRQGSHFMVFHPAWGYFAHAYGLEQVPVEIEGKNPKPAQLKELIEQARENGIKALFVQPQFSTKSAELVAREIGGHVVFADPLAEDWTVNLRNVAGKLAAALR